MSKRFLLVQLGNFGDCLYATTIAQQIKRDYPDSHLTWAIFTRFKSILKLNPHVDAIWEIPNFGEDFRIGWRNFEKELEKNKADNNYDEVIISHVSPFDFGRYNGTIRRTKLNAYKRKITVSLDPVVRLSDTEVKNVELFVENNSLKNFKNIVLFECSPSSQQSKVTVEFASEISKAVIEKREDVCFIISSATKIEFNHPQIIDASSLTYRENAELTKHCTLLLGCSSGITWLSTSDWAKKLPMLQLLDKTFFLYGGVHFDFEINKIDNSKILEMIDYDKDQVIKCLLSIFENGIEETKILFHQTYKPSFFQLDVVRQFLLFQGKSYFELVDFINNYLVENEKNNNKIQVSYTYLMLQTFYYCKIRYTSHGFFFYLRKLAKNLLQKKNN